ncbi:hypothetical protein [Kingella sp. (in: b-proteobacteria)]|nr:hypothetical protein [Kingella sp. (in: b-proteobacteria)]MDO4658177.1 hypothetical protein [Kingella sp. (in: b-proteobacteria)]
MNYPPKCSPHNKMVSKPVASPTRQKAACDRRKSLWGKRPLIHFRLP